MSDRDLFISKLDAPVQFGAIPEPQPGDSDSIHNTILVIKENLEVLTRQRGTYFQSAATVEDLLKLGVVASNVNPAAAEIPVGTKMLFYQASAPTGWIEAGSLSDHALRVVSVASTDGGSAAGATDF